MASFPRSAVRIAERGFGNYFVGVVSIFSKKAALDMVKGSMKAAGNAVIKGNMPKLARASMGFLGTAAGVTYVSRIAAGRGAFRDRRGKRDILPFIPFI